MPTSEVHLGDCRDVMATMAANSVDAIVTDPPYGLEFMGKEWDRLDDDLPQAAQWKGRRGKGGGGVNTPDPNWKKFENTPRVSYGGKRHAFRRCASCGKRQFSGSPCECESPEWVIEYPEGAPTGMVRQQRWHESWAREAYRVLKPGGHLLAFGGTRTFHRLACALEDAGFEIRDTLSWLYGSGFPKSLNVSRAHDAALGIEVGEPPSAFAAQWVGWGTALKPAWEPIILARKPLIGTVAANVAAHSTGGLNIDATRIDSPILDSDRRTSPRTDNRPSGFAMGPLPEGERHHPSGRWPANVVLDEAAAALLDEQSGERKSKWGRQRTIQPPGAHGIYGDFRDASPDRANDFIGDTGGASRFFYVAKASRTERNAGLDGMPERAVGSLNMRTDGHAERNGNTPQPAMNHHPTVKPIALMRWLSRLICPPNGTILDPFMGSGTTGCAAALEGVRFIGIEQDADYLMIARRRVMYWQEFGEEGFNYRAIAERRKRATAHARCRTQQLELVAD